MDLIVLTDEFIKATPNEVFYFIVSKNVMASKIF
jgi:hypothetical protein